MPPYCRPTTCCTWLRVLYHRQALTIYSAVLLAAALALAQVTAATWAKAAAIFCVARLGWFLWGALRLYLLPLSLTRAVCARASASQRSGAEFRPAFLFHRITPP